MNIGIVTSWFERGAAYVSDIYKKLLEREGHTVYVFARGGENIPGTISAKWNGNEVTRSNLYIDSTIEKRKFLKWVLDKSLDAVLFNEQIDFRAIIWLKKKYPKVVVGAYVDYYTENSIELFGLYDFLICNTKRHLQAMQNHPQKYYIPWGTDINLFCPRARESSGISFFHSAGLSKRKGTDYLIDAFIDGKIYSKSQLVIHTQQPIEKICKYTKEELAKYNIQVIEETVPAPGLYYKGDVYVYPTRLDGLGLTMYEAISSGLPMIVTDFPPMNEVGDESFVRRIKVKDYYCRGDAYYYPMAICDKTDLIDAMVWYVEHPEELRKQKEYARQFAEEHFDILTRSKAVSDVFEKTQPKELDRRLVKKANKEYLKNWSIVKRIISYRFVYNMRHRN